MPWENVVNVVISGGCLGGVLASSLSLSRRARVNDRPSSAGLFCDVDAPPLEGMQPHLKGISDRLAEGGSPHLSCSGQCYYWVP